MNLDMERALRGYVARGAGLNQDLVRPGNQFVDRTSARRPDVAHATMLVVREDQIGYGETYREADATALNGIRETTTQIWDAMLSVQFYRKGALATAQRFASWVNTPDGLLWERRLGREAPAAPDDEWGDAPWYASIQQDTIAYRRLDEVIADKWEERAVLDLRVRYFLYITSPDAIPIEDVTIKVSADPPDEGTPLSGQTIECEEPFLA